MGGKRTKPPGKPGQGRSDDDGLALWRRVAESVTPLAGRTAPPRLSEPKPSAEPAPGRTKPLPRPLQPRRGAKADEPGSKAKPLTPGTLHDIDKRTAERLKRGRLPVEARLDLHGMTQAQAERALTRFLADAQSAGLRNVLLITGKGRTKGDSEAGVLRRELPRWLNQPRNRDRVVALSPAQPKDGGEGAFYLRLKRVRDRS